MDALLDVDVTPQSFFAKIPLANCFNGSKFQREKYIKPEGMYIHTHIQY